MTTVADICSGKAKLTRCAAETVYMIAKALDVSMEYLLETERKKKRATFENFKSNECHSLKEVGDVEYILNVLEKDRIREYFEDKWYPEALYLLAMIDYLSRINDIPLCTRYDDIRQYKLQEICYPMGIILMAMATNDEKYKEEALKNAIPEFLKFNIVESEVRNVY